MFCSDLPHHPRKPPMSDKILVEEMARAMEGSASVCSSALGRISGQLTDYDWQWLAQAAATIAERRMEEMRAERDKWKQRAFELECEHGDLKGVFVESRAALRPLGGV
jgi:hypothetical protein